VSEGVGVLRKIHDSGEDETPARVGLLGWEVVIAIGVAMGGVGGGVRHCSHEYVEICIWYFHEAKCQHIHLYRCRNGANIQGV
jgi:hypothetical protein